MITIKVKFRKSTVAQKKGAIYYLLTDRQECKCVTTSYRIHSHEWDANQSLLSILSAEYQRRHSLVLIENSIIRDIVHLQRIIADEGSIDIVIKRFRRIQDESKLSVFGERVANELRVENKIRTARSYSASIRSFLRYRDGLDITFEELSPKLIQEYEKYLKEQLVCNNTISFYMRNLRAIYNRAVEENYTEQNHPFKKAYVGNDKTIKRAINEEDISRLKELDLSSKPWLALARDLFMFSFYARGMPFVDLAHLTKDNISGEYIVYHRHKTGQELNVKLEPRLRAIIDRHAVLCGRNFLLPILSDKGNNYDSALRLHNLRLKYISTIMGLPRPLTSYVARHSWATLAKKRGISTQVISEGMGHNNEKTTQIYLSALDRTVIDDANAKLLSGI